MANQYASMGYIGYVQLGTSIIRATSCDIKTSQEISYPDVVDGRADTTIYQMGPKVTGGTVAFPLIHDLADTGASSCIGEGNTPALNASQSIAAKLWRLAAFRDSSGRLDTFDTSVRYSNSLSYVYPKCMVNTLSFTIQQSDAVQVSCEVFGGGSGAEADRVRPITNDHLLNYLSPARVITFNDAVIALFGIGQATILGSELREFSVTINNNLERFYTLNGRLSPFDIAAKKREIGGNLKIIGHNINLTTYAEENEERFTSESQIGFGFKIGPQNTQPYWATGLNGIIYEIETVAIATGLFETDTKWRATGRCDAPNAAYDATYLGANTTVAAGANYGTKSTIAPVYFD